MGSGNINPSVETWIGQVNNPSYNFPLDGWLDELRVSKGIARHLTNFPLAAEYVKDVNTVLLLHFDGADGAVSMVDSSGSGPSQRQDSIGANHLQSSNSVRSAIGIVGDAADFERDNVAYLRLPNSQQTGLDIMGDISIFHWFKMETFPGNALTLVNRFTPNQGYATFVSSSQKFVGNQDDASVTSTSTINPGRFYHLGTTYDGASYKVWVDSIAEAVTATTDSPSSTSLDLLVGAINGLHDPIDGLLDEVIIANRWLREEEVKALYNRGLNGLEAFRVAPQSTLEITPADLDFGSVVTNRTSTNSFQLLNRGTTSVSGNASVSPPFSVVSGSPFILATGQTGTLTIVFSPFQFGSFTNDVVFTNHQGIVIGTASAKGQGAIEGDADNDGLRDEDERYVFGTNPFLADTDGDGMPDEWEIRNGPNPLIPDAAEDLDRDGLTNLEEYTWNLTHTIRLDPAKAFMTSPTLGDFEVFTGQQTNRFHYDRNDRLVGAEYARGLGIAYVYDGNGNPVRQVYFSRAADTNGVPTIWKAQNGLSPTDGSGTNSPWADPDRDGWSNFQEWRGGSSPTNSLRIRAKTSADIKGVILSDSF